MALDDALMDVPVLRTMLALEKFDEDRRVGKAREVLHAIDAASKAAEMQSIPDINRLRRAQAGEAEMKVADTAEMRDVQRRLPEILRRGDPAEIEAAHARLDPQGYTRGQYRDRMSGMPDPVKLQEWRALYEQAFARTGDQRYKKRADEINGILTQRSTSSKELAIQALVEQGVPVDIATKLVNGALRLGPNATGGTDVIDVPAAVEGGRGSSGPAVPPAPAGEPAALPLAPSPYKAQPPGPGVHRISEGTKPAEKLNEEVQQLSTQLKSNQISMLDATARQVERLLDRYEPGKTPGVGFVQSAGFMGPIYGALSASGSKESQEAQSNRSNMKRWGNTIMRMSAGLAQTVQETANVLNETLLSGTASEADIRGAYNDWRHAYEEARAEMVSGYAPEVISEFYRRQGQPAKFWVPSPEAALSLGQDLERRGIKNFQIEEASSRDYGGLSRARKSPAAPSRGGRGKKPSAADFDRRK